MPEYNYCEIRKRQDKFSVHVTLKTLEFIMPAIYESNFVEELNELMEKYINI